MKKIKIKITDALIIVDPLNDFCSGALPVSGGDEIMVPINKAMPLFKLVIAVKEAHPENHCSFKKCGGPWPAHGIDGTWGANFHPSLNTEMINMIVKKGTNKNRETYSGFDETGLTDILRKRGVKRIFVCGLATDYCVHATAMDGLEEKNGFEVYVILDAVRAVNVNPDDGESALKKMKKAGAKLIYSKALTK